ncbi:MAG: cytochrome P450 [Scytonema sp. PMC 1069.18]|nr:cytochrome P450 [Scytonema sp. PMC 1069.18]MEC4886402.1 cytochrome P450 [Scytonema sp. PMC 1070.18]
MTVTITKSSLPLPPGNFGLPIIGETIDFLQNPEFIKSHQKQYGEIFKTYLFGRQTVVTLGAEANRFLFTNEKQYLSQGYPHSANVLVGRGSLVTQSGSEHQTRRKIIAQAFQPRVLTAYLSTLEAITQTYLHKWEQEGTFTWYPYLRRYTLQAACQFLVGRDADNDFLEWYETWGKGIFSIPLDLPWTTFGRAMHSRSQLLAYIDKIVHQRQQDTTSNHDALGILLQARDDEGNSLSSQEIKEQLLTLLFAGHETLTSALSSLCLLLPQHPEVLEAARQEQKQLPISGALTFEHLKQMTYLEQVIKEVMRLIPPAFGAFRKVIKPFELNGYLIPQNWYVLYLCGPTHQDSSIYIEPERFYPQRFAPGRAEDKQKTFGYIPFGGGMRECIGKEFAKLEMKLFAALLIREFEWELLPKQNLDLVMLPTTHPRDGLKVKFRRR